MKTNDVNSSPALAESEENRSRQKEMYQNWLKEKGNKEKNYEVPYLISSELYHAMEVAAYALGGENFKVEDYLDMILENHLKKFGNLIENANSNK